MSKIYKISGEEMNPIDEKNYDSEDDLQERISEYPALLAGDQMDESENKSWLLVTREYNIPDDRDSRGNWSIDHLFLDEDGVPTFVEVKRGEDPRVRRKVVGQMLDYVAHAVAHGSGHDLRNRFESRNGRESAVERVAELIGADYDDHDSIREFWDGVNTNLRAGRVRMLFAAGRMPPELRSIIEFLNEQMGSAEVLGVEVKRYSRHEDEILVPSLVGDTTKSKGDSASISRSSVSLKDLIVEDSIGLSKSDTIYMNYKGNKYESNVRKDGKVIHNGKKHSLSSAAKEVAGTNRNGWIEWETEDGKLLDDLRDEYGSTE
jgi:hypothetical protein